MDGVTASELFQARQSLTYDDIIILPGRIDFGVQDVNLTTKLTREIELSYPITSSPMDTVTESEMAISLALLGGIGFIHYNNTVDEQAAMVRRVKRFENGFITDPMVLGPDQCVRDIHEIREKHGFSGIPITDTGDLSGRVIGVVTNRDIDFESNLDRPLRELMTTDLVTAKKGVTLAEANDIIRESKKGKLPILDEQGRLEALVSRHDLLKNRDFPDAVKSNAKQLRVGAAISTRDEDRERLEA
ncbi:MAG: IMP dehydrogenase, partial [Planctomycetota bacterium]